MWPKRPLSIFDRSVSRSIVGQGPNFVQPFSKVIGRLSNPFLFNQLNVGFLSHISNLVAQECQTLTMTGGGWENVPYSNVRDIRSLSVILPKRRNAIIMIVSTQRPNNKNKLRETAVLCNENPHHTKQVTRARFQHGSGPMLEANYRQLSSTLDISSARFKRRVSTAKSIKFDCGTTFEIK